MSNVVRIVYDEICGFPIGWSTPEVVKIYRWHNGKKQKDMDVFQKVFVDTININAGDSVTFNLEE
jgi:hypothetical protein